MVGTAGAIGLGLAAAGTAGSIFGANKAAGAAQDAATASKSAADAYQARVFQQRREALDAYNSYSPAQASAIEKGLATQERNVQRQETLVNSIDPALVEAGKQMHSLLMGQAAPVLNNLKDQRQTQRQNLLDTIRQQYGPGYETSSAGLNAMQKFDAETANILNGAQQSYLQQVSGIALSGSSLGATLGAEAQRFQSIADAYGKIGLNKADIMTGANGGMNEAAQAQINTAGAGSVGAAMQGKMWGNIGQGLTQIGGLVAGFDKPSTPKKPGEESQTQENSAQKVATAMPTPYSGAGTYSSMLGHSLSNTSNT
jgi:hypothetical protein